MTESVTDNKFRGGRGETCEGCLGDLTCCIEMNGAEPWVDAPSRLITEVGGERTIRQIIHENGRTFLSIAGQRWTPPTRWSKGYWTDTGQTAVEQKGSTLPAFLGGGTGPAPYEVHATGCCERCTQQYRRMRDATSRAA